MQWIDKEQALADKEKSKAEIQRESIPFAEDQLALEEKVKQLLQDNAAWPTEREKLFQEWEKASTDLRAKVVYLALRDTINKADEKQPMDRAHWFDVELTAHIISHMPGPKPSFSYVMRVAERLRGRDNWRPLTHQRNIDERSVVEQLNTAWTSKQSLTVQGHALVKVREQVNWLVRHQLSLPPAFVRASMARYAHVTDSQGERVLDRRRFSPSMKSL